MNILVTLNSNYLDVLRESLIKKGYVLKRRSNDEVYEKLKQRKRLSELCRR